jgi:hypothetical protein
MVSAKNTATLFPNATFDACASASVPLALVVEYLRALKTIGVVE